MIIVHQLVGKIVWTEEDLVDRIALEVTKCEVGEIRNL